MIRLNQLLGDRHQSSVYDHGSIISRGEVKGSEKRRERTRMRHRKEIRR